MKIAIVQSNYIPWKGYFDLISYVDKFVIYDDAQFTKNDWRNRNIIKTPNGIQWLTIPVSQGLNQKINEVDIVDSRWRTKHWKTLEANYAKAAYFRDFSKALQGLYEVETNNLSKVNTLFIRGICNLLEIRTEISDTSGIPLVVGKTARLVDLCHRHGATTYVSGPAAKSYLDEGMFRANGINVEWMDYNGYPTYPQLWNDFEHGVSVIDGIFNCGMNFKKYCKFMRH